LIRVDNVCGRIFIGHSSRIIMKFQNVDVKIIYLVNRECKKNILIYYVKKHTRMSIGCPEKNTPLN